MTSEVEIPTIIGLKESIHNAKVLYQGAMGESCPRCGSTEMNKGGYYNYNGKKHPRKICRDCGYAFSTVNMQAEGSTRNRAARILNLDDKKVDVMLSESIQFGMIKDNGNGTYTATVDKNTPKEKMYRNVPIYQHLLNTVGYDLKRRLFEEALRSNPDKMFPRLSPIKRDTLWRRYKEIAIEVFVCEKCAFGRTCKKDHKERAVCDTVKKSKEPKIDIWI
jgi:transposase-like protein